MRICATEGVKLSGVDSRAADRTVSGRDFGEAAFDAVPKVKAHRVNLSGKRTKLFFLAPLPGPGGFRRDEIAFV